MRFLPSAGGQAGLTGLGAIGFALHTFTVRRPAEMQGKTRRRIWVLYYRQRDCYAHLWRHPLAILFSIRGRHSPARKAGMTGTHLWMSQAGNAGIQLFPLFLLPKRLRGFEDKSTKERSSDMKYHAVWKPGGRPRRGMGSMKPSRRQLQALKPRGTIPGKGAVNCGGIAGKAA